MKQLVKKKTLGKIKRHSGCKGTVSVTYTVYHNK